jgi:hypothetical protein
LKISYTTIWPSGCATTDIFMKKIEDNPELKKLFETIQKEVEEHTKKGGNEAILSQVIMQKYQHKLAKYGSDLMPLFQIMQKMQ